MRSPTAARPAAGARVRVALVDGHELVREGLRALIDAHAADAVDVVYSGDSPGDARDAAPGVVLLGVDGGPGTDPMAHSTRLLVDAGIPVLLLGAFDHATAIRAGLAAGAVGFLPRSLSYGGLIEALRAAAVGQVHPSAGLPSTAGAATETPELSPRESEALRLYAAGLKLAAVAHRMGISPHTAREYLDRVRAKYQQAGRRVRTRTELYVAARRDGLLAEDAVD